MAENKEELKSLLVRVKQESKKAGLKLNIQNTKIMAESSITSWQIDAENVETETNFIFLGSSITKDDDCSHEIKRYLLLGRKAMTNLDNVLKSRHRFAEKVHMVKAMVFPVVIMDMRVGHKEVRALKNWCFLIVVLEKTLESPLGSKGIKTVNPKRNQP